MFYYSMHSPRGAGGSFVIGAENEAGGFQIQEGFIPENEVYIGVLEGQNLHCLPFFAKEDAPDAEENFDIGNVQKRKISMRKIPVSDVTRTLSPASDCWEAPQLRFELLTPVKGIPDPAKASYDVLKRSVAPVIGAKFTVKNQKDYPVTGFFGVQGMKGVYPLSESCPGKLLGVADAGGRGFAVSAEKYSGICREIADFSPSSAFSRVNQGVYQNCEMGGFCFDVPAGQEMTVDFVIGWFLEGNQTRGFHKLPYYYTRFFSGLEELFLYGTEQFSVLEQEAREVDREFEKLPLSAERRFFISQSIHCYWASTMLFSEGGRPRYIVNEGSYMMMNTFDLSVDHLFYECFSQAWSVKNQLKGFWEDYSYFDTVHGVAGKSGLPGGISFTHDQGSYGTFTRRGYSCYEMTNKEGCLSYMSQEELLNWILSAAIYVETSGDTQWQKEMSGVVSMCLISLLNRDDPNPAKRDGVMDYDGDRCGKEGEITTYDSLDEGLGQARRNLYLAVKCWAGYLAVARLAEGIDETVVSGALEGARRCAQTVSGSFSEELGFIPAILDGKSKTGIIPAIEALVYPYFFGYRSFVEEDETAQKLVHVLKQHLKGVLKPGVCLFEDGGWRLSSGSTNTWMSKIFLCEYVAEEILGLPLLNEKGNPDAAALSWWQVQCARCPGIDQVVWGAQYSRGFHYPRAVTSVLWMADKRELLQP